MNRYVESSLLMLCMIVIPLQAIVVVGHRGACGYAPENTAASFNKAIDLGVDMIELDIRRCKSGELIVFHDNKLNRVSNSKGLVADKTLSELKEVSCNGQQVMTLLEALDCIDKHAKVILDIKEPGLALPAMRIVSRYITRNGWHFDDFIFSSFLHAEVVNAKKHFPHVRVGYAWSGLPLGTILFEEPNIPDVVIMDQDYISKIFIDTLHRLGKQVFVYTVNDEEDIQKMCTYGVDGIISDYPDRVKNFLQQQA